jgi:predicted nucleotidyltransferase component of viral defense system
MDKNSPYFKQASLLIRTLPLVAHETCFALKGGTAINLFVRDLPRLSVDIDLVYLPIEPRNESIANIHDALDRITEQINHEPDLTAVRQDNKADELRIMVTDHQAQIKIETSPVARGVLNSPSMLDVVETVEEQLGFASIQVASKADLYGGKICAALDRQHPRDLFDIKLLLENEGMNRDIFNGFLVYLLSHNRPIAELMNPNWGDISEIYHREFLGMTFEPASLQALEGVREELMTVLKTQFTQKDFDFLMSFKSSNPDWTLAPKETIQHLPAIKWKLENIRRMAIDKHTLAKEKLEKILRDWL